jgi:hypothetical protein
VFGLSCTGGVDCLYGTVFCFTSSSSVSWWTTGAQAGGSPPVPVSGCCRWFSPSVFALLLVHFGTSVAGTFTWTLKFNSLPTTSEPVSTQS